MKFSVYQISRRGGREKNEDRMGYCYTQEAALFTLADGMGGHPAGEVASQLALETLAALFQQEAQSSLMDPARFLNEALLAGHRQLLRYATRRAMLDTPRTTVVACVIQGGVAYWAHCGDSRLYLVREGRLVSRTRDHSYSELQHSHRPGGSARHYNRNVLFTCLGSPAKPVMDVVGPVLLQPGDRLLLCSDGLWGSVSDDVITRQLATLPVSQAVPELVEEALRLGGPKGDNVTALAVHWEAADDEEESGSISTQMLGEEKFSSTIESPASDHSSGGGDAQALDEAEIDRSIREINEAIRRSAKKSRP